MHIECQGTFLSLSTLTFTHPHSQQPTKWETCQRNPPCVPDGVRVDAVDIIATWTDRSQVFLVKQFRPALMRECIEFPSGLLDAVDGGDVVKAAHREFQEETGYVATVGELVSGPVAYEPGLTNSGSRVVVLRVDPLDEHNVKRDASIYTSPEADEAGMETLLVPHTQNMLTTLQDMLVKDPSLVLDSRVHAYALALKLQ